MSYYLSKRFVVIAYDSKALKNITARVKQCIHAVNTHANYLVVTFNVVISSVDNNLNKFSISTTIFNEFTSTYYDDKNGGFGLLFKTFTANSDKNIDHPD